MDIYKCPKMDFGFSSWGKNKKKIFCPEPEP
jgi:hypothetical protein